MSAIDELCGIKKPVQESTMSTSMPSTPVAATVIPTDGTEKKKVKLSSLLMKKKLRQEADEKPVIPDDARPDETAGVSPENAPNQTGKKDGAVEAPLPTSIALVAPDTTPNSEEPLDPSQVPQPASAEVVTHSSPNTPDDGQDALRTLIGGHQESFNPKLITDPTAAAAVVTAALNGQTQSENSSPAAALKASEVMAEATAAKPQAEYKHNPDSMNRGIAVTRQILGM